MLSLLDLSGNKERETVLQIAWSCTMKGPIADKQHLDLHSEASWELSL